MKNLLKNNIRSWKNNKISIIGLSFLTFFGLGSYCVLANTTANISTQYAKISEEGKLHDITVSEMYNLGNAHYQTNTQGIICTATQGITLNLKFKGCSSFWKEPTFVDTVNLFSANASDIQSEGTYYFPIPEIELVGETGKQTFIKKYHITLDEGSSTGLYSIFANYTDPESKALSSFDIVITENYVAGSTSDIVYQALQAQHDVSNWTEETLQNVANNSVFKTDFAKFNTAVNDQTTKIGSAATTNNTPITNYLKEKFSKDLEVRNLRSLNVIDKDKFYKMVESNPNDEIDKIVLFKDINGRTGETLFNRTDFAPFGGKIEFIDKDGKIVPSSTEIKDQTQKTLFIVPNNMAELMNIKLYDQSTIFTWDENAQFIYSQLIQIRSKAMLSGKFATQLMENLYPIILTLSANSITDKNAYFEQFKNNSSDIYKNYATYYTDWYKGCAEIINIAPDEAIAFTWTVGLTPESLKITNWTTKFAIVNPQWMKTNNYSTLDPIYINKFEPYYKWYKYTYKKDVGDEIEKSAVMAWLNTLTSDQVNYWIKPLPDQSSMIYQVGDEIIRVESSIWKGIGEKNIVPLAGFNLVIWGCGLTPDFIYPVVDYNRPTPNSKTEAVVYANEVGYNSVKHGFAGAVNENYIVGRFKGKVSTSKQNSILNEINTYADNLVDKKGQRVLVLPQGTKVAFYAADVSNLLNTSAIRVSCIPGLINMIRLVTIILSSFIVILCVIICFIIIKRFVEANRVNIGIMRANGFTKKKIALSLIPFAIVPSVAGGVGAYIIGFALQVPALLLFKDYWALPTALMGFSPVAFVSCILLPFLLFAVISIIATMVVLRTKAVDLMKSGSEFKTNGFSRIAKKPFKKFSIMTRFRVSLAFNSITRLLMLTAVSTLTMSTLVFAMTSYNRLAQSQKINASQIDYKYSIDLTTPTFSGGTYSILPIDKTDEKLSKSGLGLTDVSQYWYNTAWDLTENSEKEWYIPEGTGFTKNIVKPYAANQISLLETLSALTGYNYRDTVSTRGTLMLPNMADSTGQAWDILYLQSKMCSKLLLDYNIGIGSMSSNPWELALALMPINSRNLAAAGHDKMVQNVGKKVEEATEKFNEEIAKGTQPEQAAAIAGKWFLLNSDQNGNDFSQFFTSQTEGETKRYTLITDISTVGWMFMAFNIPYIKLLSTIYSDKEVFGDDYTIIYGGVEMNTTTDPTKGLKADETYTYVNATIDGLSTKPRYQLDKGTEIKIEGIVNNSQYMKLTDKDGEDINVLLLKQLKNNNIPVIVNAFAAHKYNLKKGSTIDISATNTVDRYDRQMNPSKYKDEKKENQYYKARLEVVGISIGTNGEGFYINQNNANKILGLPDGTSWNQTHKYMMYTSDDGIGYEWANDNLPKLVDVAFDKDTKQCDLWSFEQDSTEPTSVKINAFNQTIPTGFNGIYTSNKEGKPLTQVISLYSCSGLWPGTAVFKSSSSQNKMVDLLANGNNLALANKLTSLNNKQAYEYCAAHLKGTITDDEYRTFIDGTFLTELAKYYGTTTMVTAICGAMDVSASDLVYSNLITTLNMTETSIMAIIIPITIIIVGIISNLIITDSKKMAAMLKALGYSDMKNIMSILSLFLPAIALGLLLAIPLSFGLVAGYQAAIFTSANILVDVTQKWWYYAVAIGGIGVILFATYIVGYRSVKKDRLVDQIK